MPPVRKTMITPRGSLVGKASQRSSSPPPQATRKEKKAQEGDDDDFDDVRDDIGGGDEDEGFQGDGFDALDSEFADDPNSTFGSDPNYNNAVSKAQYIRVHFIKPLKKHIDDSTLMPDTKATLKIIAEGLFDKTQVLAKRKNLRLAEIEMDIILAQARIGFHQSDVDNPDLANVVNLVRNMYIGFISRSENGWERELDNRMETSHTNRSVMDSGHGMMPGGGGMMGGQKAAYPFWHYKRWL